MPSLGQLTRMQIALLAVAVAVLLNIAAFTLLQINYQTLEQQDAHLFDLERELRTPRGRNNPAVVQRDLEAAQQLAAEASLAFPDRIDIIVLQDHIVRAAVSNLVQLTNLSLQAPITRDLTAGKYPIVDIVVEGQGDLPGLQGFLDQVGQGVYGTIVLENLSVSQGKELWNVKFDTVVYGKPG